MKKVLSILSTFVLTSSVTLVLTSNVNIHNQQNKNENKTDIDWNGVKNQINTYFKDIKNNNQNKLMLYSTKNNAVNFEEAMKKAQEKSSEYITRFESQNLSSNEITNVLLNENSDFKENYQNALQQQSQDFTKVNISPLLKNNSTTIDYDYILSIINSINNRMALNELDQHIQNLKIIGISFTTVATAAAIAAVAFFAVAFFTFGATSAWGTGCSIIAATLGSAAAILDLVLLKYNKERENLEEKISTGIITFNDIFTLGHLSYTILSASLPAIEGTLSATSWAFPAGVALIGVIAGILGWISFYK